MKSPPKVGRCVWCGHWGLLWGRWCKHPWKKKPTACRVRFNRWVRSKNGVAPPLPREDFIPLGPQQAPDVFRRFFVQPGTAMFIDRPPLTVSYGSMRKRYLHD